MLRPLFWWNDIFPLSVLRFDALIESLESGYCSDRGFELGVEDHDTGKVLAETNDGEQGSAGETGGGVESNGKGGQ